MYLIRIDHLIYTHRDGTPFTLPEAVTELRGCGNAAVLRLDGTVAVRNAGSDSAVTHAPTGRVIRRRRVLHRRAA